jgi:hypothetical protein
MDRFDCISVIIIFMVYMSEFDSFFLNIFISLVKVGCDGLCMVPV